MRVSIPKGFHSPIQRLMQQLQTDDPALAVTHIVGCWLASNGCPGSSITQQPAAVPLDADEFSDVIEF